MYVCPASALQGENSQRWLYYRKRTEGQNTIVLNKLNQASAPMLNPSSFVSSLPLG